MLAYMKAIWTQQYESKYHNQYNGDDNDYTTREKV